MVRSERRLNPGRYRAVVYALLVHALVIAGLVVGIRWSSTPIGQLDTTIQATVTEDPDKKKIEDERRRADEERKKAEADRKRQEVEAQRKREQRHPTFALAQYLANARLSAGLTQSQVADQAAVPTSELEGLERGSWAIDEIIRQFPFPCLRLRAV